MADVMRCTQCGYEMPAGGPRDWCPRCALGVGLGKGALTDSVVTDAPQIVTGHGGVIDSIEATVGPVPRVLLRDPSSIEFPSPIVKPTGSEPSESKATARRLHIFGEIARGGMGSVLKGRDPDLGRDLAIKVLRDDLRGQPEMVSRFVEEAQIAGQLQHPGVIPVYEMGQFSDDRPFFSMKLVKGHTLSALLSERESLSADRARLLGIFEHITQTVAYAHSRGVIHRDLKPSNVMVGNFGEVLLMDWGLAKLLSRGGVVDDARATKKRDIETVIATARSLSDSDLSQAGSVLGTPSYMAPEQARGEIESLDERSDVFSLGSILCEILTGEPAVVGSTSAERLRRTARGDFSETLARLDACDADAELKALCVRCLAPEQGDRPRDAGHVSEAFTAYLADVQQRLRAAELTAVEAQARAD